MPTKPEVKSLNATSVDILNSIRYEASNNYKDFVPRAVDGDVDSIRKIGNVIMQYQALQNEFLSALVNRIGRVILTSRLFENPLAIFKKGMMEFGETVEEVFTNIAKPFEFDPEVAETDVFKRVIPDVRAAFHVMNYTKFYKSTIQNDQLRQAFLSFDGVNTLIASIVDAMYTGANYDEMLTTKYLLARHILDGNIAPIGIGAATAENSKTIVTSFKTLSNDLTFLSPNYNMAGVMNASNKDDQFLIVNTAFDAIMDVEVLASAFNMSKAEFLGHRVLIDGFGKLDTDRLNLLFAEDPGYQPITDAEMTALNNIPAVLVDRDFFMIFDNYMNFTENYNGQGLYWQYFYHTWKTFSVSPFANAAIFVPGDPSVTSVAVSPSTASIIKGQSIKFAANVVTQNFAPKSVKWTVNSEISTIDIYGNLTVPTTETATSLTVTATSTFDATKSATASVTVTG